MTRSVAFFLAGSILFIFAACTSFDEPSSSSDGGAATTPDGGGGTGSFCASKSNYDVCSDFDSSSLITGWDEVNGPNGAAPKVDSSDAYSAPSSLRFDFTGESASDLGLTKVLGPGKVYHIETAVRFDGKVQKDYVDVAKIVIGGPSGELDIEFDMLPTGLHYGVCPLDTSKCVYGNPDFDLREWKTIAFDFDLEKSKVTLTIGGIVISEETPPPAAIEKMTVTIGPRQVASGNTVVVRYDDILISHR